MQRYNRNGEIEHISLVLLDRTPSKTVSLPECPSCNATHCFYHIHHTELTEGYLSGCGTNTLVERF